MKIAAMSCCVMDIFPQLNKECVGGNSVNFAIQCRKSKIKDVAVVGAVGTDSYGEKIIARLKTEKIDTSRLHVLDGFTATHIVMISENGERLFLPGNWHGGVYDQFQLSEEDWDFIYKHDIIAEVCFDPNFETLMNQPKRDSKVVVDFLDVQEIKFIRKYIKNIDVAFISGTRELADKLVEISKEEAALIVVTLGARGSMALLNGMKYYQDAIAVKKVVDTTGCGDAYQAAFTVAWYNYGDIKRAMLSGSEAAARVIGHTGAV